MNVVVVVVVAAALLVALPLLTLSGRRILWGAVSLAIVGDLVLAAVTEKTL